MVVQKVVAQKLFGILVAPSVLFLELSELLLQILHGCLEIVKRAPSYHRKTRVPDKNILRSLRASDFSTQK